MHTLLGRLGRTVATAESLTGGLLVGALTEPAGASAFVRGGLVVYATDLKATLAGVDTGLLARVGAVDPEVAVALAVGVRQRCSADYGVGVTGVAGPAPQDGRPVGTVYLAVAGPTRTEVMAYTFTGRRADVRTACVTAAVGLLAGECRADLLALHPA